MTFADIQGELHKQCQMHFQPWYYLPHNVKNTVLFVYSVRNFKVIVTAHGLPYQAGAYVTWYLQINQNPWQFIANTKKDISQAQCAKIINTIKRSL